MLKVRGESMRALEHFIWEIRALESVERTKTVIVLGTEFEGRPGDPSHPRRGRTRSPSLTRLVLAVSGGVPRGGAVLNVPLARLRCSPLICQSLRINGARHHLFTRW